MAILLECARVVIPIANIKRCVGAPPWKFLPGGGYLGPVEWYDNYLYCDGAMSVDDVVGVVAMWEERGLKGLIDAPGGKRWEDLCVAYSGRGPTAPCDWLEYDRRDNCVWLRGKPKGRVIGGTADYERWRRVHEFEAQADAAYTRMYDATNPTEATACYNEAKESLYEAIGAARDNDMESEMLRLEQRLQQIKAVFRSQFRY
ncbi:MAG: hypothetical protein HY323_12790 [Betaproteobacteria bacterium]|nr:hypothetical protein [Betaproteobacteria bacterium]